MYKKSSEFAQLQFGQGVKPKVMGSKKLKSAIVEDVDTPGHRPSGLLCTKNVPNPEKNEQELSCDEFDDFLVDDSSNSHNSHQELTLKANERRR
jgi:hypothetical protein